MINNISDVPKGNLCLPGILKVEASVQNQKIPILLDTGAKANCIDFKCVEAMSGVKMKSTNRNLVGANNSNLNVKGCVTLNVSFEGDMICYEEDDEDHEQDGRRQKSIGRVESVWEVTVLQVRICQIQKNANFNAEYL